MLLGGFTPRECEVGFPQGILQYIAARLRQKM